MTQNEKIAEIVSRMKSHFGKGDGGGSNYYIDTYVLDELGKWLTEALSHNGEEVVWTDAKVINFAHFLEAHDELTSNEALQKFKKQHSTPSPIEKLVGIDDVVKLQQSVDAVLSPNPLLEEVKKRLEEATEQHRLAFEREDRVVCDIAAGKMLALTELIQFSEGGK